MPLSSACLPGTEKPPVVGRAMPLWMLEDPHGRQAPAPSRTCLAGGLCAGRPPLNPSVPEEDVLRLTLQLTFRSGRSLFGEGFAEIPSQTDVLDAEEKAACIRPPGASAGH